MELSRWHTANLLLPVSQVAQEGEGVYYYCKAACLCAALCLLHHSVIAAIAYTLVESSGGGA